MSRRRDLCLLALLAAVWAACAGSGPRLPREWQKIHPSFTAPVHDLVRDLDQPRFVYAACGWQTTGQSKQSGGVLRSSDNGERWLEVNRGLPPGIEVEALAFAPAGFAWSYPALLAGTRGAGVFVSINGGLIWRPLGEHAGESVWRDKTVQTLVGLPGEPPAVAAGTRGHGVLISGDGGVSWQTRNEGLLNLTIQTLALAPGGDLVAATWTGGIYRSSDRGRHWVSLDPAYQRVSISTLAIGADGTLWAGLQNGGLVARPTGAAAFEPQGGPVLAGVGVLAIAPANGRVVVGTSGRGAALGRLGGDFSALETGLDNKTVETALVHPERPGEVILGTWGGLYRSVPPPSLVLPAAIGGGLAGLTLVLGFVAWRRSVRAEAGALYRRLSTLSPSRSSILLNREIAGLPLGRGQAVAAELAGRLARSRQAHHQGLAEAVAGTAGLLAVLRDAEGRVDAEARRAIADALDARIPALEALAGRREADGVTAEASRMAVKRDKLFAALLRADGLGHLAALRGEVEDVGRRAEETRAAPYLMPDLVEDLRAILDTAEELSRLPSAEDRGLFLGQALTHTLGAQERLAELHASAPSFGSRTGTVVLESLRQLLTTALEDVHQRAELEMKLRSKELTTQREAVVVLEIRNVGQGHARNVAAELEPMESHFRAVRRRREVRSLLRNQSARLEFLVEPKVSDRVRLTFRITYDDLGRQGHHREFADVVHFRQIEARHAFRPLRPNPYVVGRPLLDSDIFIGRTEVFERILDSLRGANQDNVVVLIGQRRMGKTSILRRLGPHLGDDYVAVLVDLQGLLGSGETAFFREVVSAIRDELEEAGIEVEEPPSDAFESDPGHAFRRQFLGAVRRALGDRRLLLAFDEFEVLEERIRAGELEPRILPFFRSLMQHEKNVSFMFAGTHRLDELTEDYWSVLFNLAVYLDVGHLPQQEVAKLFTEPTREAFEIDPLALDKVYRVTGGHPHFSQLLARELIEHRNQQQLSYVTVQDVNLVASRVADKGQLHIAYLWNEASRTERLLLLVLKALLEREGLATLKAAYRFASRHRVELGDLPSALRKLTRKEILSDNAGQLSFRMELLKLWLDGRHDLESFLMSEGHGSGIEETWSR